MASIPTPQLQPQPQPRPQTARPSTQQTPRPDWYHVKPIHVIPRSLSKQSRRATGSGPPARTAVEYNILNPPPPHGTSVKQRSTPTFTQSSIPFQHSSRPPSPTSAAAIAAQNGHTRGIRTSSGRPKTAPAPGTTSSTAAAAAAIPNPITGVGVATEAARKKKSVVQPDRTPRPQGKGMVTTARFTATTSGSSGIGALGPLVGASEPAPLRSAVNGTLTTPSVTLTAAGVGARSPNRRLGAGMGCSLGQFGASSVSFNILAPPPPTGPQPKPSSSMTFIPKA